MGGSGRQRAPHPEIWQRSGTLTGGPETDPRLPHSGAGVPATRRTATGDAAAATLHATDAAGTTRPGD